MLIINVRGLNVNTPEVTYVGRGGYRWEGSPLGNPILHNKECPVCGQVHQTAGATIPCYKIWLFRRIKAKNPVILSALKAIKPDSLLGCWCGNFNEGRENPTCHAEVVAAAVRWMMQQTETPAQKEQDFDDTEDEAQQ